MGSRDIRNYGQKIAWNLMPFLTDVRKYRSKKIPAIVSVNGIAWTHQAEVQAVADMGMWNQRHVIKRAEEEIIMSTQAAYRLTNRLESRLAGGKGMEGKGKWENDAGKGRL
jgi:hypothetical protein